MAKSTIVITANEIFVQRLLSSEHPIETWEDEHNDKIVWHYEWHFELCCNGSIGVIAIQKDEKLEEYEIIKSWRKPITFDKISK